MIFGKHINRYYLRFLPLILLGLAALVTVDYLQLLIPELYQMVINGMIDGQVLHEGVMKTFDMQFLLYEICAPLLVIILFMVIGRLLWRVCFMGSSIFMETDMRNRMFSHCKELSREYYQVNKVGNLMSLFTNDMDNLQECYGWGIMMMFDAVFQGVLALIQMFQMDVLLTVFSFIPMMKAISLNGFSSI